MLPPAGESGELPNQNLCERSVGLAASSITIRNWGLSVIRLLSASSTYSRTTIRPELKGSYSAEGSCSTTISTGALRATINSIGSVRLSLTG